MRNSDCSVCCLATVSSVWDDSISVLIVSFTCRHFQLFSISPLMRWRSKKRCGVAVIVPINARLWGGNYNVSISNFWCRVAMWICVRRLLLKSISNWKTFDEVIVQWHITNIHHILFSFYLLSILHARRKLSFDAQSNNWRALSSIIHKFASLLQQNVNLTMNNKILLIHTSWTID